MTRHFCDRCQIDLSLSSRYGMLLGSMNIEAAALPCVELCQGCYNELQDWTGRWMKNGEAHRCYHCGLPTNLGTAWCEKCLHDAEENRKRYPPRPPRILPRPCRKDNDRR